MVNTLMEIPTVSEQKAEPNGGASAPLSDGPAAAAPADAASKPPADSAQTPTPAAAAPVAPDPAPKRGREKLGLFRSKPDAAKPQPSEADALGARAKAATKPATTPTDDRTGAGKAAGPAVASGPSRAGSGKRWRPSALAIVVVLAAASGALGGTLATLSLRHFVGSNAASPDNSTLEASVVQMDTDIQELKASVEQNAKLGLSQFNSASDRLDLVEKAQAKLTARPAKLSEAMDKVGPAPPAAAATTAVREATGSMAPPAAAVPTSASPVSAPKVGQARTLQGWVLTDVVNGGAVIQSRQGTYEVFAGDAVPGLGRVDAIRRQDGRWVVVTAKGLIVER